MAPRWHTAFYFTARDYNQGASTIFLQVGGKPASVSGGFGLGGMSGGDGWRGEALEQEFSSGAPASPSSRRGWPFPLGVCLPAPKRARTDAGSSAARPHLRTTAAT